MTTNTPTPLPADYVEGTARDNLAAAGMVYSIAQATANVAASAAQYGDAPVLDGPPHVEVWLDWAAALRDREGLTWAGALQAAEIAYFG